MKDCRFNLTAISTPFCSMRKRAVLSVQIRKLQSLLKLKYFGKITIEQSVEEHRAASELNLNVKDGSIAWTEQIGSINTEQYTANTACQSNPSSPSCPRCPSLPSTHRSHSAILPLRHPVANNTHPNHHRNLGLNPSRRA
jgi:hypothetical protein